MEKSNDQQLRTLKKHDGSASDGAAADETDVFAFDKGR